MEAGRSERVMSIRKLAALDTVFRGPRLVLAEFGLAIVIAGGLGVLSLRAGLLAHGPVWEVALGAILLGVAVNYVPLLAYAIGFVCAGTAREAAAHELEHMDRHRARYGLQQFLLIVPLAVAAVALVQARRRT